MRKDTEFRRVSGENKEEMARLLIRAKGSSRTMKQFAIECGVHPSTFSRILNKSNKGASTDKMVRVIAEHAEPESGVTLDALMAAHGMVRVLEPGTDASVLGPQMAESFKEAILYQLGCSGDLLEYYDEKVFKIATTFQYCADFVLRSKSVGGINNLWAFDLIITQSPVFTAAGKDTDRSTRIFSRRILETIGRILPLFYNDSAGSESIDKFSFVVVDKRAYDYLTSEFVNYIVPFNMSFIFYNSRKEIIEQEFVLRNPTGKSPVSIINEAGETNGSV